MPATAQGYSGKYGQFYFNGATYQLTNWSIDYEVNKLNVTNFTSRASGQNYARQQLIGGISKTTVSADGYCDGVIAAMAEGNVITVRCGITASVLLSPLVIRLTKVEYKNDNNDKLTVSFSGESLTSATTSATTTT